MRWLIGDGLPPEVSPALAWLRLRLDWYDLRRLDWFRISRGHGENGGVYGRCWSPHGQRRLRHGFRISCQVQGPWPCSVVVAHPPIYRDRSPSWPPPVWSLLPGQSCGRPRCCKHRGRVWLPVESRTPLADAGEGLVWIAGHELFHFLCSTGQLSRANNEVGADAAGDAWLTDWRRQRGAA